MLHFLRNIRQKLVLQENTRKYLLYAFGEIFLVVIGILIALQVNNWNQQRQNKAEETLTLNSVVQSLREDSLLFVDIRNDIDQIDVLHRNIYGYVIKGASSENIQNLRMIRRVILYNPVTMINHPDLVNELIDSKLKQWIRTYYQHMDDAQFVIDDYNEHLENVLRPFLGELQVYNYGYQFQIPEDELISADSLINRDILLEVLEYPEVQQVLFETGLKYASIEIFFNTLIDQNKIMIRQLTEYQHN